MSWLAQLDKSRGSRPRCVQMMSGARDEVARRLADLINLDSVKISASDIWMPRGKPTRNPDGTWDKTPADELKLSDTNDLIPEDKLAHWWLAHTGRANTPNWDIASTCTVADRKGLLLIEAKAHLGELAYEVKGKKLDPRASANSFANHVQIGRAIAEASATLQKFTSLDWAISRDTCYQMSNRFAFAAKLTELGYPVVLVYLGFLNAQDMSKPGETPFAACREWADAVHVHSAPLFPTTVWDRAWMLNGQPFIPLIRSCQQPLSDGDAP